MPPGETPLDTAGGETITAERTNFIKIKSSAGEAFVTRYTRRRKGGREVGR